MHIGQIHGIHLGYQTGIQDSADSKIVQKHPACSHSAAVASARWDSAAQLLAILELWKLVRFGYLESWKDGNASDLHQRHVSIAVIDIDTEAEGVVFYRLPGYRTPSSSA